MATAISRIVRSNRISEARIDTVGRIGSSVMVAVEIS